jgi:hypothetical protein
MPDRMAPRQQRDPFLRVFRKQWRLLAVVYVAWIGLHFGVEAAARWSCRVPGREWIEDAADVQGRLTRNLQYNKSMECLDATRWHAQASDALFKLALAIPGAVLVWYLVRIAEHGWLEVYEHFDFGYGAVVVLTLVLTMLPYYGAMWVFERYGFAP